MRAAAEVYDSSRTGPLLSLGRSGGRSVSEAARARDRGWGPCGSPPLPYRGERSGPLPLSQRPCLRSTVRLVGLFRRRGPATERLGLGEGGVGEGRSSGSGLLFPRNPEPENPFCALGCDSNSKDKSRSGCVQ